MSKECFVINGGNKLYGEIRNQTSKNATLPILSASILSSGVVEIRNVPKIKDVDIMLDILQDLGAKIEKNGNSVVLSSKILSNFTLNEKMSKKIRSSIFLLGPLLAKFKYATVSFPGGCKIGLRPIDVHLWAFKKLGVKYSRVGDKIFFNATKAKAKRVKLKMPSVGATENIIQFACMLKGKTVITNCAKEPEIVDLCNFLNRMGAYILGAGTNKITIYGVDKLNGAVYTPIGDRIVAGTVCSAVAVCGGDVTITNACPYQNEKFLEKLSLIGCQIDVKNDIIHIRRDNALNSNLDISTGFYPDFPTDLQSMMLVVGCGNGGITHITENLFENRFMTVHELQKMEANIDCVSSREVIVKKTILKGAKVKASDLRGGASLVLAGLMAEGETVVTNIEHIDRGYEKLEEMFVKLGADIKRIKR